MFTSGREEGNRAGARRRMRVFRKIEAKDNAAMAELIRSTLKKCKLDISGTAYFDEGLDRLSEVYDCPGAGYYVLEDAEGSVVGGIGYAKLDFRKDTAELQKLYLDERQRGSGCGYEMIRFIEERMREDGYRYAYLETHDNLPAAIHIYEKCGYAQIERPAEIVHSTMTRFYCKSL